MEKKKGRREEPAETQSDGRREKESAGAIRAAPLFGDDAEHRAGEGRAEAPTALQPAGDDGGAAQGRGGRAWRGIPAETRPAVDLVVSGGRMKTARRRGSTSCPPVARQHSTATCFICCCATAPEATVVAVQEERGSAGPDARGRGGDGDVGASPTRSGRPSEVSPSVA